MAAGAWPTRDEAFGKTPGNAVVHAARPGGMPGPSVKRPGDGRGIRRPAGQPAQIDRERAYGPWLYRPLRGKGRTGSSLRRGAKVTLKAEAVEGSGTGILEADRAAGERNVQDLTSRTPYTALSLLNW
ncbi:hypothetical protein GCM10023335_54110 [Streptomyces siamensis]|uniref:Uncharacterized protein n=1 Tax=Streptomyces siamensis TaxID=1274986 RepID=A0ABP9J958_9ACTN